MEKIQKLLDEGKFARALSALEKSAVKDLKETSDGEELSLSVRYYFMKAEAFRGLGRFAEAQELYEKTLAYCKDENLKLEILLARAKVARTLGDCELATASAEEAVEKATALNVKTEDARLERAMALRLAGKLEEAETVLLQLCSEYRKQRDPGGVSFANWALGGLYRLQGRYEEGIKAFEASLKYAMKNEDEFAAGYALFGLGGILRVAGFMGKALDSYLKARQIFEKSDDTFAKAYVECGTSNVLRQMGRLDMAWTGYKRAHRLYSKINDYADLGFVEWGMGEILLRNADFGKAGEHFDKALEYFGGHSEPRGTALAMLSAAKKEYLSGETDKAEKSYSLAMDFIKKHGLHTHLEQFT